MYYRKEEIAPTTKNDDGDFAGRKRVSHGKTRLSRRRRVCWVRRDS
jgi:hypothetical protein